ncbi:MAG: hypothetical protein H7146_07460, partial [Burkholderiaceae bacterium]|nr:hypothetical protein [Microbacteriaceae bacterium]
ITYWKTGHGNTDLADGILLCRRHHLMVHHNQWEIVRIGATYWVRAPKDVDPTQTLRELTSKSPPIADLKTAARERQKNHRT